MSQEDPLTKLRYINHTPKLYISMAICIIVFIVLLIIMSVANKWNDMNYLIPFICAFILLFSLTFYKAYITHLFDEEAGKIISNIINSWRTSQQNSTNTSNEKEYLTAELKKLNLNNYEIRYFNKYCKLSLKENARVGFNLLASFNDYLLTI